MAQVKILAKFEGRQTEYFGMAFEATFFKFVSQEKDNGVPKYEIFIMASDPAHPIIEEINKSSVINKEARENINSKNKAKRYFMSGQAPQSPGSIKIVNKLYESKLEELKKLNNLIPGEEKFIEELEAELNKKTENGSLLITFDAGSDDNSSQTITNEEQANETDNQKKKAIQRLEHVERLLKDPSSFSQEEIKEQPSDTSLIKTLKKKIQGEKDIKSVEAERDTQFNKEVQAKIKVESDLVQEQNKVKQLEKDKTQLTTAKDLTELSTNIQALKNASENTTLQETIKNLETEREQNRAEITKKNDRIAQLGKLLKGTATIFSKQHNYIDQLKTQLEQEGKTQVTSQETVNHLQTDIQRLDNEKKELDNRVKELEQERVKAEKERETELTNLKVQYDKSKEFIGRTLRNKIEKLKQELQITTEVLNEKAKGEEELKGVVGKLSNENEKMKTILEELAKDTKEIGTQTDLTAEQITQMEKDITKYQTDIQQEQQKVNSLTNQINTLQEEIKGLQGQVKDKEMNELEKELMNYCKKTVELFDFQLEEVDYD
ncbi:17275_t:CDS:2 [Entrophospora sp. SA101]|nr:17275_t:CDS:2 [Entrophospora sp. SA101]